MSRKRIMNMHRVHRCCSTDVVVVDVRTICEMFHRHIATSDVADCTLPSCNVIVWSILRYGKHAAQRSANDTRWREMNANHREMYTLGTTFAWNGAIFFPIFFTPHNSTTRTLRYRRWWLSCASRSDDDVDNDDDNCEKTTPVTLLWKIALSLHRRRFLVAVVSGRMMVGSGSKKCYRK